MTLDDARIRDLLRFDDESGVLSFYVGITPDRAADPQPTAPLELRSRIKALKADLEARDPDLAKKVEDRLEQIQADLDRLVDPHAHGRGRALFVGVGSGRTETVSLQIPFADRVVHHDGAYVRPLVAAHDEGRAAGILNVSRETARVMAWSLGEVEELSSSRFEVEDDVMARSKTAPVAKHAGYSGAGVRTATTSRRASTRTSTASSRASSADVSELIEKRDWDRVVVAGNPKLREDVAQLVRDADNTRCPRPRRRRHLRVRGAPRGRANGSGRCCVRCTASARPIWWTRRSSAASAVTGPPSGSARCARRSTRGVSCTCCTSPTSRSRATGPPRAPSTPASRASSPNRSSSRCTREPLFVERMIEKAVATGALVTPVDEEAAAPLGPHEGVGALAALVSLATLVRRPARR